MTHFFNSSVLEQATYNESARIMLLTFRGNRIRTYSYDNVDSELWHSFIMAESAGTFFNDNIRNNSMITYMRVI